MSQARRLPVSTNSSDRFGLVTAPDRSRSAACPKAAAWLPWDTAGVWLVLALTCAFYVATAGVPRLFDQIDGQYAGASREMLARGDALVPTQDGVPRLQKPPLLYWLELEAFRLFGVNEFAARLPVTVATLGWFAATGAFAWRITRRAVAAAAAALVLATCAGTFFFTHLVMPEPLLSLAVLVALHALWSALDGRRSPRTRFACLLGAYACMALGALAKGLHALAWPALACTLYAAAVPGARAGLRRAAAFWPGWLLFAALLAPWYAAIEGRYPGFLVDHFWNEQIGHVFNRRWPPDTDRVPLLIFWAQHLVLWFPWSLALPMTAPVLVDAWTRRRREPATPTLLLLALFLVNALTISFSSIQDYYLLPAWPVFAVMVAAAFCRWDAFVRAWCARAGAALAALGLAALAGVGLWQHASAVPTVTSSPGLEAHLCNALGLLPILGQPGFPQGIAVLAVIAFLTGSLVAFFSGPHQPRPGLVLTAFGSFALLGLAVGTFGLQRTEDFFSSARFATRLRQAGARDLRVACESEANDYTSLFFYLNRPVYWVNAHPNTEFATRELGIGRQLFLTEERLTATWPMGRWALIIHRERLAYWQARLHGPGAAAEVVLDTGDRVLLIPSMADPPPLPPSAAPTLETFSPRGSAS